MLTKSNIGTPRRNRWIWFAWFPLIVFGAYLGTDFISRKSNNDLLANYRKKVLLEGAPADVNSLVHWYEGRTHSESTERWGEIIQMILTPVNPKQTPVLGDCELPNILDPNEPWKEAEYVKTYLQHTEVVRHEIIEALKSPAPVRVPMKFEGLGTTLEFQRSSRSIYRYLELDFEYAYYTRDTRRALQDIRLMGECTQALNSDLFIVGGLVQLASQQTKDYSIRRSLTLSQWSEMELQELLELSNSSCVSAEQWRSILYSERCYTLMAMDEFTVGEIALLQWNSREQSASSGQDFSYLRDLEFAIQLTTTTRSRFFRPEQGLKTKFRAGGQDAISFLARAASKAENARHWTRTAIALRLYQKLHGKYPENLNDLQTVGLTPDDTALLDGTPFGYEIENGIAYLWTTDFTKSEIHSIGATRSKRPESTVNQTDRIEHLLELR